MAYMSIRRIMEVNKEHEQYDVIAKVVGTVSNGYMGRMRQWGVLADLSGEIRFTSWKEFNDQDIEVNTWYNFSDIKYRINNFTPNLTLDRQTSITKLPNSENIAELEPIEFDFSLPYHVVRVRGVCLGINPSVPPMIKQKGWIGNAEGFKMPFTMFNSGTQNPLELGKIYDIQYASIEHYNPRRELYVDCAIVTEISSEIYVIDPLTIFLEIDIPHENRQSKQIYSHIYSTAQEICG